jgi:hypothetical protein
VLRLQAQIYRGVRSPGGTLGHLSDSIYREVAYIAYHFNWSKREIMEMTHHERRKWMSVIVDMNKQINANNERNYSERMENLLSRKEK